MPQTLDARLHHVCLRSPAPQRLAAFYDRVMEMPATRLDSPTAWSGGSAEVLVAPC